MRIEVNILPKLMKKKTGSSFFPTFLLMCALGIGGVAGYQHFVVKKPLADLFQSSDKGGKSAKKGKLAKNGKKAKKTKGSKAALASAKSGNVTEEEFFLTDTKDGVIPGSYIGSNLKAADWADPAALRKTLGGQILAAVGGTGKKDVKKYLETPQNKLLIAQYQLADALVKSAEPTAKFKEDKEKELAKAKEEAEKLKTALYHAEGTQMEASLKRKQQKKLDAVAALEAELAQPLTMEDLLMDKDAADLLDKLCNNTDWLMQMTCTGECVMPVRTLNMLSKMVKQDPGLLYDQLAKDTATAVALEFGRYGWETQAALGRAHYYIKHSVDKRLNASWYDLPFFLRRNVLGWKGNHDSGTVEAQEWALNNAHIPDERYTGACWRCGYKLYNVYGDSIHGSNYYEPFVDQYNHHFTKTYEVGGVCGGLSHFGCAAAIANGVPALTTGEPGHCSYVVYVNGKWTPAYSLSWERGLHWQPFTGVHVYTTLHAAEEMYTSPDQTGKTEQSNALRAVASAAAAAGDTDKAIAALKSAESAQPRNFLAWRDHTDLLKAAKANDAKAWLTVNEDLCKHLVPLYPEVAGEWARQNLLEGMGKAVTDKNARMKAATDFWNSVKEMGVDRWRIEQLAEEQMKMVNAGQKNISNEEKVDFFSSVLKAGISKPAYAPVLMAWGNTLAEKMDDKGKQAVMAACTDAFSGGKGMDEEQRNTLLKQLIAAAENMRDVNTFQTIAKMLPDSYKNPKNKLPQFDPFPGQLVSKGGVFFPQGTSRFDDYLAHWGLLEPSVGGFFHTANVENAWGAVRLPKHATLSGVVVINTAGKPNWGRLNGIRVQVSETGKDDDWHDVGKPIDKVDNVMRFDLSAESPKALYVRILRPGKEFFHFQGLFVYGKPAA